MKRLTVICPAFVTDCLESLDEIGVADKATFISRWHDVNAVVHAIVAKYHGSISAEHGIGFLKHDDLPGVKDPVAFEVMQSIKHMFDPLNILNPGKVL